MGRTFRKVFTGGRRDERKRRHNKENSKDTERKERRIVSLKPDSSRVAGHLLGRRYLAVSNILDKFKKRCQNVIARRSFEAISKVWRWYRFKWLKNGLSGRQ